jgi:hypothetical protein
VSVDPTFSAFDAHGNQIYNLSNSAFLVLAPGFIAPPRVASVAPTSGPVATAVTITGTGFTGATAVSFGLVAAPFSVVSDTSISAVVPQHGIGTFNVRVRGPGGISPRVDGDRFTVTAAPLVVGLTPSHGSADGGTSVTINGVNFSGATAARFGGVAAKFTVISATSIKAVAPPGADSGITVDVTVTTPRGTSAIRAADQFTYT